MLVGVRKIAAAELDPRKSVVDSTKQPGVQKFSLSVAEPHLHNFIKPNLSLLEHHSPNHNALQYKGEVLDWLNVPSRDLSLQRVEHFDFEAFPDWFK